MHSKALVPMRAIAVASIKPVSLRRRLRCSAEVEPPKATPATPKSDATEDSTPSPVSSTAEAAPPKAEPAVPPPPAAAASAPSSAVNISTKMTASTPAAAKPAESPAQKARKPSPLAKGGSLSGEEARGKDPAKKGAAAITAEGDFQDNRWINGTWNLDAFKTGEGKVDWDAVIDAEVVRRKWLEDRPESTDNAAPVTFMLSQVPWWAWVKRFHLPEAEKVNGRAAMIGYVMAYFVDLASGHGLVDQQSSFLGKTLLFLTVVGCAFIRKSEDLDKIRGLVNEATFYDRQWQSTWNEGPELPEDALPGRTQEEDLANPPKMR